MAKLIAMLILVSPAYFFIAEIVKLAVNNGL